MNVVAKKQAKQLLLSGDDYFNYVNKHKFLFVLVLLFSAHRIGDSKDCYARQRSTDEKVLRTSARQIEEKLRELK